MRLTALVRDLSPGSFKSSPLGAAVARPRCSPQFPRIPSHRTFLTSRAQKQHPNNFFGRITLKGYPFAARLAWTTVLSTVFGVSVLLGGIMLWDATLVDLDLYFQASS